MKYPKQLTYKETGLVSSPFWGLQAKTRWPFVLSPYWVCQMAVAKSICQNRHFLNWKVREGGKGRRREERGGRDERD